MIGLNGAGKSTTINEIIGLLTPYSGEIKINGLTLREDATNYRKQIGYIPGAVITVREGQEVGKGDVLARIPQASSKTRDITGGLPRVAELFEARVPKDAGMLAEKIGRAHV